MGPFLPSIFLILVIAILLQIDFIFYVVYVSLGVYGWSKWLIPRVTEQILVERKLTDHAFLGEEQTVTINLTNQSRWRLPWIKFGDSIPLKLRISPQIQFATSLGGKETKTFTYQIKTLYRGYFQVGPLSLETGDYFGFARERAKTPAFYLTVYPKITPLTELGLPSRLPFGTLASQQRLFADPARPMGVRPFRSGDSLRQINWKVSAHTNGLLTKTFEPAISLETMIVLDLNTASYQRQGRHEATEWGIEVAASVAAHLTDRRQAVGFLTNGVDPLQQQGELQFDEESGAVRVAVNQSSPLASGTQYQLGHPIGQTAQFIPPPIPPRTGRPHLMKILEILARLKADDTIHFPHWLPLACHSLNWGVTIFIITPTANLAVSSALHRLAKSGYNPVLILTQNTPNIGEIRERGRRLGYVAYEVARPADLQRWQQ